MAPSRKSSAAARASSPTRLIITRSIHKKLKLLKQEPGSAKSSACSTTSNINNESKCGDDVVCCTPRGKKYTIPKISACPPAPKKKRLVLNSDYSRAAATTKFFSHPDLDVFFLFSNSGNSVQTLESN